MKVGDPITHIQDKSMYGTIMELHASMQNKIYAKVYWIIQVDMSIV